jgi:general secretion pathway protein J
MTRRRQHSEDGFTLIEMLVATTLLAFLSLLLFGGLRFGVRAWDRSQQLHGDAQALRTAQDFIVETLAEAYPARIARDTHGRVDFSGANDAMRWITMAGPRPGAMSRVELGLVADGDTFELVADSADELSTTGHAARRVLLSGVVDLAISYYGRARGEAAAHWSPLWRDQTRLPALVRIRIRFQDKRTVWPDLVVAPRITADAGCSLDSIQHDCAGY